jgi:cytochrome c556
MPERNPWALLVLIKIEPPGDTTSVTLITSLIERIPMRQVLSARSLMALICISFTVASAPAAAQFKNAKHAVEYRQGAFKLMGVHFGSIGAMVNGKKPFDAAQAAFDANVVKTVSALPWAAFGDETESIKSGARAEIWLEKEEFLARSKKMQTATAGLLEAAKTGDQAKLKVAFGDTARSCKACHDAYKE